MNELSDIFDVGQMLLWFGLMIAALVAFALLINFIDPRPSSVKPRRKVAQIKTTPGSVPIPPLRVLSPSVQPQIPETCILNPT